MPISEVLTPGNMSLLIWLSLSLAYINVARGGVVLGLASLVAPLPAKMIGDGEKYNQIEKHWKWITVRLGIPVYIIVFFLITISAKDHGTLHLAFYAVASFMVIKDIYHAFFRKNDGIRSLAHEDGVLRIRRLGMWHLVASAGFLLLYHAFTDLARHLGG